MIFSSRRRRPVAAAPPPPPAVPVYYPEDMRQVIAANAAAHMLFRVRPTDRALAGWLPPQAIEEPGDAR